MFRKFKPTLDIRLQILIGKNYRLGELANVRNKNPGKIFAGLELWLVLSTLLKLWHTLDKDS